MPDFSKIPPLKKQIQINKKINKRMLVNEYEIESDLAMEENNPERVFNKSLLRMAFYALSKARINNNVAQVKEYEEIINKLEKKLAYNIYSDYI